MIHSMSGGIIKDPGAYTFVKAVFDGETEPQRFAADFAVDVGDRVVAPYGPYDMPKAATVVEVEHIAGGQVLPVSLRSVKKLISYIL